MARWGFAARMALVVGLGITSAVGCNHQIDSSDKNKSQLGGENGENGETTDGTTTDGTTGADGTPGKGKAWDPNATYQVENDYDKAYQIATRLWALMTAQRCWYMYNTNNSYQFSGANDYRYSGYETTAGQVQLVSAGTYNGYDTIEVIISGTRTWIGAADARTLGIGSIHLDGVTPVHNWWIAAGAQQQCI